jgi:hypothetical protein
MPKDYANLVDYGSGLVTEASKDYVVWTPSAKANADWTVSDARKLRRRSREIEMEDSAIEAEVEASRFILSIEAEADEIDFVPYRTATWDKAITYLRRLVLHAHSCGFSGIGTPEILPASQGAISLYWSTDQKQLLMTFPSSGTDFVSFYGKKPNREISGRFRADDFTPELVYWLAN